MTAQRDPESHSLPAFSHIYVEEGVLNHPRVAAVRRKFPRAKFVEIESLGELTGRKNTVWSYQKSAPKLVLAEKTSQLLYPCSDVAPNFGHPHFYYAVPMQNCLYDCEYCYLQGMYNSAHLVLFVNQEEMRDAVRAKTSELGSLYLCIAYDNDLLAMEGKLGLVAEWVEGLRDTPRATIEVRTKSANFASLRRLQPAPNVILAWTLSPSEVATRFEAKTPSLESRLAAAAQAVEAGWRVRFCLDPLLPIAGWREAYAELFTVLDRAALWSRLDDASYGTFRMNKDYLRQARKARPDSQLLQGATAKDERGLHILPHPDLDQLLAWVGERLQERLGRSKVFAT
jgi:spore photoproduct lyase